MGDSPITNTIKNVAGYGVGTLAALDTIKGGGLGSYLMNRQRLMSDPGFRSTMAGSPFMSGVFGVSGDTGPAPAPPPPGAYPATAAGGGVVQPADMVGPPPPGTQVAQPGMPVPTAQNVPGYEPGTPRSWHPLFSPYDPEQALKQQGFATSQIGLGSPDEGVRAQSKMAAGIPLTDPEIIAATKRGTFIQQQLGPGGVVKLDIPGMNATIGSPYNFAAMGNEEYPTPQVAMAAAAARNASIPPGSPQWTVVPSGRGTYLLAPPASSAQVAPPPRPPNTAAQPVQPAAQPAQPTQPAQPVPVQPAQPTGPGPYAGGYVLPRPAPSQPVAPPPPPAASPFDRDAVVPHVVVPDARTGNPPPAFDAGSPSGAFLEQAAPAAPPPPTNANVPVYAAPQGFVFHHSGGTTLEGLRATLQDRGLGSEYLMDRDGTIYGYGAPGSPHMQPNDRWHGAAPGLTNANAYGMELVARNNADVTPAQVAAAQRFMQTNYPNTPVYGHGEVNPGHKQADEGMAVVNAIRTARAAPLGGVQYAAAAPGEGATVGFPPPAFNDTAVTAPPAAQLTTPVVQNPPVVNPPTPPPEAMPAPGGAPTVLSGPTDYPPGAQMPMTGETRRTSEGEQTFRAPDASNADSRAALAYVGITNIEKASKQDLEKYWGVLRTLNRQHEMDSAEIARMQKPMLEGDGTAVEALGLAKQNVNKLLTDFPDPKQRAYYVGTLRYPTDAVLNLAKDDPQVALFHTDVAQLGLPLQGASWIGRRLGLPSTSPLSAGEQDALSSVLPSGATGPNQFETSLQAYNDTIDSSIALRGFLRGRPVGSTSTADVNAFLGKFADDLKQRRLDALQPQQPPAPPPAPPPAAAPPPGASSDTGAAAPWAPIATWTVQ